MARHNPPQRRVLAVVLGICLLAGHVVQADDLRTAEKAIRMQDFAKAFAIYQQLADVGDAKAQYQLANLYLQGRGTPKNPVLGKRWLEQAAEQNLAEAQFGLAQLLLDNDPQKAEALLKSAAQQNYLAAQTQLKRRLPENAKGSEAPFEVQWFGAVRNDDLNTLRQLNQQRPSVNLTDASGRTALFYAIEANSAAVTNWLLNNGANVNQQDKFGLVPAQTALERKNTKLLQQLFKAGANSNLTLSNGDNLLHYALRLKQYELVDFLLRQGVALNHSNKEGWTPLDLAEYQEASKTVAALKRQGAKNGTGWRSERQRQDVATIAKQLSNSNIPPIATAIINDNQRLLEKLLAEDPSLIEARLNDDATLLILAIKHDKPEMVQVLLNHHANVLQTGYQGLTALHIATRANKEAYVKTLLAAGASPTQKDSSGRDPMMLAIEANHSQIANLLLDNLTGVSRSNSEIKVHLKSQNAPVNDYILLATHYAATDVLERLLPFANGAALDDQQRNALWFAAAASNSKLILQLLKAGIPADQEDDLGRTPFLMAVDNSCLECARQLLGFVDINHQTKSGNTALMVAAAKGDSLMSAWLIQNNAKIEVRNQRGNTAIMEAVNANSMEVVRQLIAADASVTRKNKLGFSAIDLARQTSPKMLELVKSKSLLGLF